MLRVVLTAVSLLTTLPVPVVPTATDVARSRYAFPVVGLLLGCFLSGIVIVASAWLPARVAAVIVLTAWLLLTGALHLDGFCDCCDGLFSRKSPDERLRVMKDPHLGTFALAGGGLLLLSKFVLLTELLERHGPRACWDVLAVVAVARCLAVVVAAGAVYPRTEGTGRAFVEATRFRDVPLFLVVAAGLGTILTGAVVGWVLAVVAVLGVRHLAERRIGGVTGDVIGAGVELAEVAGLIGGLGRT